jgi:hypothetical protein
MVSTQLQWLVVPVDQDKNKQHCRKCSSQPKKAKRGEPVNLKQDNDKQCSGRQKNEGYLTTSTRAPNIAGNAAEQDRAAQGSKAQQASQLREQQLTLRRPLQQRAS